MKILLDFKRGNSHGLRGNAIWDALRHETQRVSYWVSTQRVGTSQIIRILQEKFDRSHALALLPLS